FEVLAGFRPAAELAHTLRGLDSPTLAAATNDIVRLGNPGIPQALARILNDLTPGETRDICAQVAHRLAQGMSPCPHGDDVVTRLHHAYPADNGVVASLLLTPRILQPGQAMFVPAGVIHVYLSGLGVEVMANSDNVLRAGLTPKNVDVEELLSIVNPKANVVFPASQPKSHTTEFPIPVQDFTLIHVDATTQPARIEGRGPRIVLSLGEGVSISTGGADCDTPIGVSRMNLGPGDAAFVASCEGAIEVDGGPVLQTGT
ncbi:MAG TPA: mannose-6-phosphate isomerase, class I, partial [Beutenbergiaceae bacterium]|nr:mannose-6-phosphate isomerase, class I [Beutenbergiaceae bacterium]